MLFKITSCSYSIYTTKNILLHQEQNCHGKMQRVLLYLLICPFLQRSFKILKVCLKKDPKLVQDLTGANRELKSLSSLKLQHKGKYAARLFPFHNGYNEQ